ncbi:MAG TPA: hypothetical protein VHQ66_05225, partial [Myxococcota bacterium]|nr:hypothetical protein [Myxococcota bacterium]
MAGRRARRLRALKACASAAAGAVLAGGVALAGPAAGASDPPATLAAIESAPLGAADPAALSVELLGDGRVRL